jgi:hypothetical protein
LKINRNPNEKKANQEKAVVKGPTVKREFGYGSVVSINGHHLDRSRWSSYKDAPVFYGLVKNPDLNEKMSKGSLREGYSLVEFVVAGEMEWYNRNHRNSIESDFADQVLTMVARNRIGEGDRIEPTGRFRMWFRMGIHGWEFKELDGLCYGCGSPDCILNVHRSILTGIIQDVGKCDRTWNHEKRYRCYRDGVTAVFGVTGHMGRKRLGWCFETKAKSSFPDDRGFYVGHRNVENNSDGDENNTVIDLS